MVMCNLRIDFQPGPVPGQLSAVVRLVTPDGAVIASDVPQPVAVGKSITVGPVEVPTRMPIEVGTTPAVAPGLTAAQALAKLSGGIR